MSKPSSFCLYSPSKTFLLGEYNALAKKQALLFATQPYFLLQCFYDKYARPMQFENLSQAGSVAVLIDRIQAECIDYRCVFLDPYTENPGGFGASSAQYILLYQFYCIQKQIPFHLSECHDQFIQDLDSPSGLLPSGADLATHYLGNVTLFSQPIDHSSSLNWPWPDLMGVILKTDYKIATHTHLSQLRLSDLPIETLDSITQQGIHAIQSKDSSQLLDAVIQYQHCLSEVQLTCENTRQLLKQLNDCPFVLAAKGCGAQGADVILSFVSTQQFNLFDQWITAQTSLKRIATTHDLAAGIYKEAIS